MFGLPMLTVTVLFGFPLFWIVYTLIFFIKSRNWIEDGEDNGGKN